MHKKGYLSQRDCNKRFQLVRNNKASKINWINNTPDEAWSKAQLPE